MPPLSLASSRRCSPTQPRIKPARTNPSGPCRRPPSPSSPGPRHSACCTTRRRVPSAVLVSPTTGRPLGGPRRPPQPTHPAPALATSCRAPPSERECSRGGGDDGLPSGPRGSPTKVHFLPSVLPGALPCFSGK
jgi:hypothetical protein